ncbi:MAG TPA: IS66 family transposase [Roseateles sp.]
MTLTKQEHIQLKYEAKYWQSQHSRAVERMQWQAEHDRRELLRHKAQAARCEAELRAALELAQAKVRDLQQRLFGRKSEQRKHSEAQAQVQGPDAVKPRGQRRGAPGHGRTLLPELAAREELIEIASPHCPGCGLGLADFPGTEDSEVVEIEVQAYRRVIRRRRYRPVCTCGCLPGIVTAPLPAQLIARGKFGVSVWTQVLLDKFLYGRPSNRLLADLADHGLRMAPGTLAGGLEQLAPLFEPLYAALATKLRSQSQWHADETRWLVFVKKEDKAGYRWYLWVFHSDSVIYFVLDPSRSADVIEKALAGITCGVIICDRYSAYKKFARLHPGVLLAFCWAHQRRDFLELANSHPELSGWAMVWVDAIADLYRLNELRRQPPTKAPAGAPPAQPRQLALEPAAAAQLALEQAVQAMAARRVAELADPTLAEPAAKVLHSMDAHWSGLTVFVTRPWVPMDNNAAERAERTPAIGRKGFYGSGSEWAGKLAATMYSVLMTMKLWQINVRTWLHAYLQACAEHGGEAPADLAAFLPWHMDAARLAAMRALDPRPDAAPPSGDLDSS